MASQRPPPQHSSSLAYLPPHNPPHPQSMPEAPMQKPPSLDLEVTIVSAKHLKNVNWRNGDLKPYAVAYLHPDHRAATKTDDAGSTRPVWNERLTLPFPLDHEDELLVLTIDVFHSKPSETPKPLVGIARSTLKDLLHPGGALVSDSPPIRTLELRRPSGRPHGKIRIKVAVRERPLPPPPPSEPIHYHQVPPQSGYYFSNVPPPARNYRTFSPPPAPLPPYSHPHSVTSPAPHYPHGDYYSDPFFASEYYSSPVSGHYSSAPSPMAPTMPSPARPYYDRASGYVTPPSAPTDYSSGPSSYDHRTKGSRMGKETGLAVGSVAGGIGGLSLEEGRKHNEQKVRERVESDFAARDDYSDYRADY